MRSLSADSARGYVFGVLLLLAILGAWAAWIIAGRISVYAVSTTARLEADGAIVPIQTLYSGRIAGNYLVLGRTVKRGDVLIELDTNVQRLQLLEERMQGDSIGAELATLNRVIEAENRAMKEEQTATAVGIEEATARLREVEAAASFAGQDAERKAKLRAEGLIPEVDLARAVSDAQRSRATAESLRLAISRQEREQSTRTSERQSRIETLRRQLNQLSGLRTKSGAAADRLASEVELRRIMAPVDGKIGELATLRVGAVVTAGDRLGVIVPTGDVKVVAQFDPAAAFGRIHPGQSARLRLQGFPWTQYGSLKATVTNVADEVRDGSVRVELIPKPDSRLPVQHGLPGSTEIEVERISPVSLVLRIAGQMLAPRQPAEPAAKPEPTPKLEAQAR